jgi:putative endonuclease
MERYFVYAIKSLLDGRIYVGLTSNPETRIKQHNVGKNSSTKAWRPWILIYKKFVGPRPEARKEEKRLKSGSGKEFLKSLSKIPR